MSYWRASLKLVADVSRGSCGGLLPNLLGPVAIPLGAGQVRHRADLENGQPAVGQNTAGPRDPLDKSRESGAQPGLSISHCRWSSGDRFRGHHPMAGRADSVEAAEPDVEGDPDQRALEYDDSRRSASLR